ncbi:hypothetical protein F5141DRAFT_1091193 [Pisolithus sp. B1]|nr:hypothetical protein F5141DRAFT_1091193 [Pisolithus sp. B1]
MLPASVLPLEPDKQRSYVPPPIQRLSLPATSSSSLPGPSTASASASASTSNPSNIFPYLHRLQICDGMNTRHSKRRPLLLLSLSSPSFLNAVATDAGSDKPLYSVETVASSSSIWRSDPWDRSAKVADIRWPKDLPLKGKCKDNTHGARIQMNGSPWKDTTSFLKYCSLGSSRKFYVPCHPHALKWKRSGNSYQCVTATCKSPVATLESFDDVTQPKLRVFDNLGSTDDSVPQLDHAGISLSFLDHLFVTALLLVTEPEDWMILARYPMSDSTSTDAFPSSRGTSLRLPASERQWRKIMYGEPLFPSLKTPAVDKTTDFGEPANPSTSFKQWRKIVYGEPLYPSLRPRSADSLGLPPRPRTACDNASISSDSAYYSATPSSTPSTGFYDASSFDESDRLVTRINTDRQYAASPHSFSPTPASPIPSSEHGPFSPRSSLSPRTSARRELPNPPSAFHPPPSMQPWLHRSRSSPRLSPGTPMTERRQGESEDGVRIRTTTLLDDPDTRHSALSPSTSVRRRQLPTVPPPPPPHQTPPAAEKRLSQQRMLPPTPDAVSQSPITAVHRHVQSYSHVTPPQPPPRTRQPRPATAGHGSEGRQVERPPRHEKDPRELVDWMRNVSREHHRRVLENVAVQPGIDDAVYEEAPPPAYNAIDFSTPPQARSPGGAIG